MGVGFSDGAFYTDNTEALAGVHVPMTPKQLSDRKEMDANSTSGDFQSRFSAAEGSSTNSGIPLESLQKAAGGFYTPSGTHLPVEMGNINLNQRPRVRNDDGSISTVRSMSFGDDRGEVLVPTVHPQGFIMTDEEAKKWHYQTGEHLGIFKTPEEATTYAKALHTDQEKQYVGDGKGFFDRLSMANAVRGMMNPNNIGGDLDILKGVWAAITHPGDVAQGKADPGDVGKAFDLASLAVLGPVGGPAANATLGSSAFKKVPSSQVQGGWHIWEAPDEVVKLHPGGSKWTHEDWEGNVKTLTNQEAKDKLGDAHPSSDAFDTIPKGWHESGHVDDAQFKASPYEQIPFGYTKEDWQKLSTLEKEKVLNNPPPFEPHYPAVIEKRDYGAYKYDASHQSAIGSQKWKGPEGEFNYYPGADIKEKFDFYPKDKGSGPTWVPMSAEDALKKMKSSADVQNLEGFEIQSHKLSDKQYMELDELKWAYKDKAITLDEYKRELKEYAEFTKTGGTFDKLKQEATDKKFDSYIDMFIKQPAVKEWKNIEPEKLSAKEAFLRGVEETHNKLATTLANIKSNFRKIIDEPKMEPKAPPAPTEAAAKGYTEPAYRGLSIYPDNKLNPGMEYDRAGFLYSSASPMLADMYSSYLSHHPGFKVPEGAFHEGAQVMPLYINTKEYHYYDAKGAHWQSANKKAIAEARQEGKKGVIVDNVWDEPNSTNVLKPKKIFITFPKGASTVKSRFAEKFDPESPNMLHTVAGIGVGGAAGYISMAEPDSQ